MKSKYICRLISKALIVAITISQFSVTSLANDVQDIPLIIEDYNDDNIDDQDETGLIFDDSDSLAEDAENQNVPDEEIPNEGDTEETTDEDTKGEETSDEEASVDEALDVEPMAEEEDSLEDPEEESEVQYDGYDNDLGLTNLLPNGDHEIRKGKAGNLTWSLDMDDKILTISGSAAMPNYTETNGAPWKEAYSYIEKVVIGDGVTSIGDYAFYGCNYIEEIQFGSKVKSIGKKAFFCASIKSLELPDSVEVIKDQAFYTSMIETLTFGNGLKQIGDEAFYGNHFTEVTIPENVSSLGLQVFSAPLKTVVINSNKITCKQSKFYGPFHECPLESVTFADGITAIPGYLFQNVRFTNCGVVIPSTVTTIGEYAFYGATLGSKTGSSFSFADDSCLQTIGQEAFSSSDLEEITIPATVTSIGQNAFSTPNLTKVVINSKSISGITKTSEIFNYCKLATVEFADDVTDIPAYLFCGADLANYDGVISESITTIGESAFEGTGLNLITLHEGITTIGKNAFASNDLTSVSIPASVTYLGTGAFGSGNKSFDLLIKSTDLQCGQPGPFGESSIKSLEFAGGIQVIPAYLFNAADMSNCQVTIPASVTTIETYAFANSANDKAIKSLAFEAGAQLTEIKDYAFTYANITGLELPEGLVKIGKRSFAFARVENELVIPSTVTTIGKEAFYKCEGLVTVTLPVGVTSIADGVTFSGSEGYSIDYKVTYDSYAYKWAKSHLKKYDRIVTYVPINYVLYGGTNNDSNPETCLSTDTVTLKAPTRVGYKFEYWSTKSNLATNDNLLGAYEFNGNPITVYAKWTPEKYTVNFVPTEGGSLVNFSGPLTVEYDHAYPSITTTATRAGYTFDGWYTEPEGGTKVIGGQTKFHCDDPDSAALYAHWTPGKYTIRYHLNPVSGKDSVRTQKVNYDDTTAKFDPNAFTIAGLTFVEWNTKPDGSGVSYSNNAVIGTNLTEINKNFDLYAQWKIADYIVVFDPGYDENSVLSGTLKMGDNSLPGFEDEEIDELLTSFGNGGEKPIVSDAMLQRGYVLTMKYGEEFEVRGDEFIRRGYTLSGWKSSKTNKVIANSKLKNLTPGREIVVLTAVWTAPKYKITYNLNGGAFKSGVTPAKNYTSADVKVSLPGQNEMVKSGYKFAGWYETAQSRDGDPLTYAGLADTGIQPSNEDIARNLTLYASWTSITYTLKIDPNADELDYPFEEYPLITAKVTFPTAKGYCKRNGYTLSGFNTVQNPTAENPGKKFAPGAKVNSFSTTEDDEITVYAQWQSVANKITYNLNGGQQGTGAASKYYTDKDCVLPIPAKAGYNFDGWYVQKTAGVMHTETVEGTETGKIDNNTIEALQGNYGAVTLIAHWSPKTYRITINNNKKGDEAAEYTIDQDFSYEGQVSILDLIKDLPDETFPDKAKIASLNTKSNGRGTSYLINKKYTKIAPGDVTLYAISGARENYEITYVETVTYTLSTTNTTYDGSKTILLPKAIRPGYVFNGWLVQEGAPATIKVDTNATTGLVKKILKGSAGAMSLAPSFTPVTYTVVINPVFNNVYNDANGNNLVEDNEAIFKKTTYRGRGFEQTETLPKLARPGYIFVGYAGNKNGTGTIYTSFGDIPANNNSTITLYPVWNDRNHKIRAVDGVALDNAQEWEMSSRFAQTLPKSAADGYVFLGWREATDEEYADVNLNPDGISPSKKARDRVIKLDNSKKYITGFNVGHADNMLVIAEYKKMAYTVKVHSNGGVYSGANYKAINAEYAKIEYMDNTADITTLLNGVVQKYQGNKFAKNNFVFNGFATDAKGTNIVIDHNWTVHPENFAFPNKNGATITLYVAWAYVDGVMPAYTVTRDGSTITIELPDEDTAIRMNSTYDIQCSTNILFRNPIELTKQTKENGVNWTITGLDENKRYYVRVRSATRYTQTNKIIIDLVGRWSKRVIVNKE